MKKILKIIGLVILIANTVILLTVLGVNIWQNQENKSVGIRESILSQEQFLEDFTEIHEIVKSKYSHLENKQIDADSLFQIYSEFIQAAKTQDEYNNLLLAYFAELRNSHTSLILSSSYGIDFDIELVENRIFIDRVGRSMRATGVNEKDEILAVDGIPVLE